MRTSCTLHPLAPEIWTIEADAYESGIHAQLRTTVVRLSSGGLWLYSPGPLDDTVTAQLRELGPVTHLVAPNLNHYKFLIDASVRFPNAKRVAPKRLRHKRPDLPIDEDLDAQTIVDDNLRGFCLEGVPFQDEHVFFHRTSRSLLCADLVQNIQAEPAFFTRQLYRMIGSWRTFGQNRYWRFRVSDRAAFRVSMERVLQWMPERIVMAHGDIVHDGGTQKLRDALDWLP